MTTLCKSCEVKSSHKSKTCNRCKLPKKMEDFGKFADGKTRTNCRQCEKSNAELEMKKHLAETTAPALIVGDKQHICLHCKKPKSKQIVGAYHPACRAKRNARDGK